MSEGLRTCRRCGRELPAEEFYRHKGGRDTVCAECRRRQSCEWYRAHGRGPLHKVMRSAAGSTPSAPRGRWLELVEMGERRTREYQARMGKEQG